MDEYSDGIVADDLVADALLFFADREGARDAGELRPALTDHFERLPRARGVGDDERYPGLGGEHLRRRRNDVISDGGGSDVDDFRTRRAQGDESHGQGPHQTADGHRPRPKCSGQYASRVTGLPHHLPSSLLGCFVFRGRDSIGTTLRQKPLMANVLAARVASGRLFHSFARTSAPGDR